MQNRFAGLDSSEQSSAPQGYDGRGSGGRFGRGGAYTGTTVKQIQRCTSVIHLDLYTLEHLNTQAATLEEDPVSRRGAPTEEETAERRRRSRFVEISLFINVAAEAFFYLASDSRCETSWVPSQLGLSQLWDPTHLFRS